MPDGLEQLALVLFVVFVFGGSTLGYVVRELAGRWKEVRLAERNAALTKDMLDRGFAADDIVRVLAAGDPAAEDRPDLLATMTAAGYDADALVRAAAALDRVPPAGREDAVRAAVGMAEGGYDGADIVKFLDGRTPSPVV